MEDLEEELVEVLSYYLHSLSPYHSLPRPQTPIQTPLSSSPSPQTVPSPTSSPSLNSYYYHLQLLLKPHHHLKEQELLHYLVQQFPFISSLICTFNRNIIPIKVIISHFISSYFLLSIFTTEHRHDHIEVYLAFF